MRKWIIIEDEIPKATFAINTLKTLNQDYSWVYVSTNDINQILYPTVKPDVEIKSISDLAKLIEIFENEVELILLLDVKLTGVIDGQDDFLDNKVYLNILSEITKNKKYYLGLFSNKVDATEITNGLQRIGIQNIYKKDGFKYNQDSVDSGIKEMIEKWNSLYESLTIEQFISEYDKIVISKDNRPNFHVENEEYTQGLALIKRLIGLNDCNFSKIGNLNEDNIFSAFLKGLYEKKGISLFGIYLIAWAAYAKKFNNHNPFLIKLASINGNWTNFSREKMFLSWENDNKKKVDYLNQINVMFEKLFSCNHFGDCENKKNECASNQSVLSDIQIDTNLFTLSFHLCIDSKKFNDTFDSKVKSLFTNTYSPGSNESSEKILMVMKNTWGKNSGISFEINKDNNLKIKFYIV